MLQRWVPGDADPAKRDPGNLGSLQNNQHAIRNSQSKASEQHRHERLSVRWYDAKLAAFVSVWRAFVDFSALQPAAPNCAKLSALRPTRLPSDD